MPRLTFSRSRLFILSITLIFASIISSSVYLASLSARTAPRRSITISWPLEFSLNIAKDSFQQGENTTLSVSARNISNKTITLEWGSYGRGWHEKIYFDFYIIDANGTAVYQWFYEHGRKLSTCDKTLNAGEQLTNSFSWQQLYNPSQDTFSRVPVPKGTYSVFGHTRIMGLTIDNQTRGIELETPRLTFTIQ